MEWKRHVLTVAIVGIVAVWSPLHGQTISYTNETEIGAMWSSANFFSPVAVTMQTFHGVQFDGILSMGMTAGLDEYFGLRVVPIAVGSRAVLPGDQVSPYLGIDVGYGFTWLEKKTSREWHEGALWLQPFFVLYWQAQ